MQSLNSEDEKIIKYSKFFMAMILNEILKETPIKDLENVWELGRGDI